MKAVHKALQQKPDDDDYDEKELVFGDRLFEMEKFKDYHVFDPLPVKRTTTSFVETTEQNKRKVARVLAEYLPNLRDLIFRVAPMKDVDIRVEITAVSLHLVKGFVPMCSS